MRASSGSKPGGARVAAGRGDQREACSARSRPPCACARRACAGFVDAVDQRQPARPGGSASASATHSMPTSRMRSPPKMRTLIDPEDQVPPGIDDRGVAAQQAHEAACAGAARAPARHGRAPRRTRSRSRCRPRAAPRAGAGRSNAGASQCVMKHPPAPSRCHLCAAVFEQRVRDLTTQRRVDRLDRHRLHGDQVRQVLLQRRLREDTGSSRRAARCWARTRARSKPLPKVGPHHALAGRGEEHLLDQVAHMVGRRVLPRCGRCRPRGRGSRGAPSNTPPQVASTRTCDDHRHQRRSRRRAERIGRRGSARGCAPAMHAHGADHPLGGDARRRAGAGERAAGHHVGRAQRHHRLRRDQARAEKAPPACAWPPCMHMHGGAEVEDGCRHA